MSDLKEVKEALDAGLVSQAEYDDVKRDYLTAKKEAVEFQRKALRAKEESQKKELCAKEESQKRELLAKEEFQKKALRAKDDALEANKECQKMELRAKKEALDANKEFQKRELIAKEAFQQRKDEADLRTSALEAIVKHGSSLMSEEQKVGLVRDYAKMSGLDGSAENHARASKRQRVATEERAASPPQPATPSSPAQGTAPAPRPSKRIRSMSALVKEEAAAATREDSGTTICDSEDDSDYDGPQAAKRLSGKKWTEEDDAALVAALRAGQSALSIRIPGRGKLAAHGRLHTARKSGSGTPALREYLEDACPEYVYKGPSKKDHKPPSVRPTRRVTCPPWSEEEDQTFIQAHREGKTHSEIAAMLPRRSYNAVRARWGDAKIGKTGSAALRAYVAKCRKD